MSKEKKLSKTAKLQQQIEELTEDVKRVQADFANFKRRKAEESQAVGVVARREVINKILPINDSFERALDHIPAEIADNEWVKGVTSVKKQLDTTLANLGIAKIKAIDQPFNPDLHEAVSVDEEAEGDLEVVSEELQPGYTMDGHVIRHTMVKVSKRAKK